MRQIALGFFLLLATGCGPKVVKVTMNADNNSGQKGFAELIDRGASGLTITIETNAPEFAESPQSVHIHRGNCGEVGEKIGFPKPLDALADKPGRFGVTDNIPLPTFEMLATGQWIINVHDARDNQIYVSCGEIPTP